MATNAWNGEAPPTHMAPLQPLQGPPNSASYAPSYPHIEFADNNTWNGEAPPTHLAPLQPVQGHPNAASIVQPYLNQNCQSSSPHFAPTYSEERRQCTDSWNDTYYHTHNFKEMAYHPPNYVPNGYY